MREREDGTNEFVVSKQKCQITYAAIGKVKDDKYRAVITQQKMHLNGTCYDLFEIYGIKGGQDEMCVVCMSESKGGCGVALQVRRILFVCLFIVSSLTHHRFYTGICVYVQSVFRNFECNPVSVRFVEIEFKCLCTSRVRTRTEEEDEGEEGGPPAPHERSESLIRDRDEEVSTKESDVELVPYDFVCLNVAAACCVYFIFVVVDILVSEYTHTHKKSKNCHSCFFFGTLLIFWFLPFSPNFFFFFIFSKSSREKQQQQQQQQQQRTTTSSSSSSSSKIAKSQKIGLRSLLETLRFQR